MSIDDDAAGDSVPGSEDDVGGLSSNAWQGRHFFQRLRQLAVELVDQLLRHAADVFGLRPKEAERVDDLLNSFLRRVRQVFGVRVLVKQDRSD